jgi:hypothetical protein
MAQTGIGGTPATVFQTALTMLLMSASVESLVMPWAASMVVKLGMYMVGDLAICVASEIRLAWFGVSVASVLMF